MVNGHVEDEPGLGEDEEEGDQQPGQQQLGHLAPQTGGHHLERVREQEKEENLEEEVVSPGEHGEGEDAHEEVAGGQDVGWYRQGHWQEGQK